MSDPRLLHDVLATTASDAPLVTFAATGRELSAAELGSGARAVAAGFAELGVGPGDRVAIMLENRVEYLEAVFAASMLGAIVCHLHTAAIGRILERSLRLTEPRLLILAAEAADRLDDLDLERPPRLIVVGADGAGDFERLRGDPLTDLPGAELSPRDAACIYSSSGTTGPAKGVTLSHAALFEMARTAQLVMGFRPGEASYSVTPFYHANALVFMFLAGCLAGSHTVFAERFSTSGFWSDVVAHGATRSSLVGSAATLLLSRPEGEADASNSLELIAAVPRPQRAAEFERRFAVTLTEFYGSTEANLPIGIPVDGAEEPPPGTCGRVLPGWDCTITDADGVALPDGEAGQLLVRPGRPGVVSSGYWGEPEKTVELWQDLWIHTGDLMRRDEYGWFHYVDRLKDAIRVSGENVASADVEATVAEFAGIAEVGAFGVSSELGEQDIMVAVVIADGDRFDPVGLRSHCESRLPYFAVPRYFVCDAELPRTATERIRKVALRERGITAETVDLGRPRRPR